LKENFYHVSVVKIIIASGIRRVNIGVVSAKVGNSQIVILQTERNGGLTLNSGIIGRDARDYV
jgi:hypothetical protein